MNLFEQILIFFVYIECARNQAFKYGSTFRLSKVAFRRLSDDESRMVPTFRLKNVSMIIVSNRMKVDSNTAEHVMHGVTGLQTTVLMEVVEAKTNTKIAEIGE